MSEAPQRGEVWWINFDPSVGSEVRKVRPAVVISNSIANRHLTRCQVMPVTSNVDRVYRSEALITVDGRRAKAMADQVTTAAKARFGRRIEVLSSQDMAGVERALRIQLGL